MTKEGRKAMETAEEQASPQAEPARKGPPAAPTLGDIIREQATEEDAPLTAKGLSLRQIIGGDILSAEIVRKQIWLLLLITLFFIIYIALGYSYRKAVIQIDRLNTELQDAKYRTLSIRSDLTEHTRESKILDMLRTNHDSLLKVPDQPPYIIEVPEK